MTAQPRTTTVYSQGIALSGPVDAVDSYLRSLESALPDSMSLRRIEPPLELGYQGWFTKRRIIKQRFELIGQPKQLDVFAEAIRRDWS